MNMTQHDKVNEFQRCRTILHAIPCNLSYRSSKNTIYIVRYKKNNIQSYIQGTLINEYDPAWQSKWAPTMQNDSSCHSMQSEL